MNWSGGMKGKILGRYGDQVTTSLDGIGKGNLDDIARCIASAMGDTDPA